MVRKNVRIKDIARLAGVSTGTVDRVLHDRGRVSQQALEKVLAVLNQIDYRPNLIARTLGSNRTYHLAALVPDPRQDPYWDQSSKGIEAARQDWAQYDVQVESFLFDLHDRSSFRTAAALLLKAKPDGVLLAPVFYQEALSFFDTLKLTGIPAVTFNTPIAEIHPLSFIGQDLYQSGRVGAELLHFGLQGPAHFIILHIAEDIHNAIHLAEKEKGFRDYLEETAPHEVGITTVNLNNPGDPDFKSHILALLTDNLLKGIFVSTSKATYIVASILSGHSKGNIRLVGYDLLEESSHFLQAGLIDFLINQNPKRQTQLGISHLANHLLFKRQPPASNLFPLEIISRQNSRSYLTSKVH
jgi:LacI family transcriptional regulator